MKSTFTAINHKTLLCGIVTVLLLNALITPVQGSWTEDFSDSSLANWDITGISWKDADSSGEITTTDHSVSVEEEELVSQQTSANAQNYICRSFSGELTKFQLDNYEESVTTAWGVLIGTDFNLGDISVDDISFEGLFLRTSIDTSSEDTGRITLRSFIDYSMTQSPFYDFRNQGAPELLETSIISGLQDNWITISLEQRNGRFTILVDTGSTKQEVSTDLNIPNFVDYDDICIVSFQTNEVHWDNIIVETKSDSFFTVYATELLIGGVFMGVIIFGSLYLRRRSRQLERISTLAEKYQTEEVIKHPKKFQLTDDILLTLLNQKPDDDETYINELKNSLPMELIDFKYLMHPTRLMMLTILYGEYKISTSDMRKLLNISRGEFGSHKKSLETKGYILIKNTFNLNGTRKQMIYLTEKGNNEYEAVMEHLEELVQGKTPYHYLIRAKNDADEVLYPENKED